MPELTAAAPAPRERHGVDEQPIDERRLVEANCGRLQALLRREGIDALLVFSPDNWRYVTGVPLLHSLYLATLNAALLRADGGFASILALEGFAGAIRTRAPWHEDFEELPFRRSGEALQPMCVAAWPAVFAAKLARLGLSRSRIALDAMMPFALKEGVQAALPEARFVNAGRILREARLLKNAEEVRALRVACQLADIAMEDAFAAVAERSSEQAIAAVIEHSFRRNGAEHSAFTPLVFAGVPALVGIPSFSPSPLQDGQLVRIDIGCCAHGYNSCIGRTVLVGRSDASLDAAFAAVRASLDAGVAAARPGATNVEVHAAMARALHQVSCGRYALDWYAGHGLGAGAHEEPMIGSGESVEELVLQPGMCFALEPSIIVPGHGWLGLEDDLVITETGCSVVSGARIGLDPGRAAR